MEAKKNLYKDVGGDPGGRDNNNVVDCSVKLEVLADILPLWKSQVRCVLIFTQWTKMLDRVERFCSLRGWEFGRMYRKTNFASRKRLVDAFNSDESYFL